MNFESGKQIAQEEYQTRGSFQTLRKTELSMPLLPAAAKICQEFVQIYSRIRVIKFAPN